MEVRLYPGAEDLPRPGELPHRQRHGAGDGGLALPSDATSVAIVFTKRTAFAGPKYRGRFYVAGIPRDAIDESQLDASEVAAYAPIGAALCGDVVNGGYTFNPILYHRSDNTYDNVLAAVLRQPVRNQKRRQLRVGI